jgi:hypothetical protein
MGQLLEYEMLVDKGIDRNVPLQYKHISCHMIHDVMHDVWHKTRIFAGEPLSDPNTESVYSGCIVARYLLNCILILAEQIASMGSRSW